MVNIALTIMFFNMKTHIFIIYYNDLTNKKLH